MQLEITAFRLDMRRWLKEIESGGEIILTDRNRPVARITGIGEVCPIMEQMKREGLIRGPRNPNRVQATGRKRAPVQGSVSDIITELRGYDAPLSE